MNTETIYTPREKVGVKKFCVNDQDECGSVPFCHIHVSAQRIISANIFPSYKTVYVDKVYLFLLYLFWAGHVLACPLLFLTIERPSPQTVSIHDLYTECLSVCARWTFERL